MKFEEIINMSCYTSAGTVSSEKDIELAEQYILFNKEFIDSFPYIVTSNNKMSNMTNEKLLNDYNNIWKDYFGNKVITLPSKENKGHTFGIFDVENAMFDYTLQHKDKIKWVWKFAFDVVCDIDIFNVEVEEADLYYINNIGFGFILENGLDVDQCLSKIMSKEYFYPQTPYYIMRNNIDELNESKKYNEYYKRFVKRDNISSKPWEFIPGCDCETFLKECVIRNNLTTYNLLTEDEYREVLNVVIKLRQADGSLKNVMFQRLGNLCHLQWPDFDVFLI